MISNVKIVVRAVLAAGLLLASDARPLADKKSIVDDKKWVLENLSIMTKSRTTADAAPS